MKTSELITCIVEITAAILVIMFLTGCAAHNCPSFSLPKSGGAIELPKWDCYDMEDHIFCKPVERVK